MNVKYDLILKPKQVCLSVSISLHYNAFGNGNYPSVVGRVSDNGPGARGLIPGRIIPKILKMVLDTSLLNTQQNKVRIKGKVEQSRERSSTLSYTLV